MREMTISDLQAARASGSLTTTALVATLLEAAKARAGDNIFITLDEAGARAAAAASDAAGAAPSGPLQGVPLVIKDNIAVAGLPNTAGTPALKDWVPATDAPVVARLRAAGAIILGKTNMHELAFGITSNNSAFGAVANAYAPDRIARRLQWRHRRRHRRAPRPGRSWH
ncbi:amidase family protein [Pannonibacter sp. SL95]|uniref:amidase family protein n=1 Tax=Pannonibacter sp. SL95 TaxID=2995153 RepID=UPI002DD44C9B|nr:amidase family protein [Pannonibacter sp. SL95]